MQNQENKRELILGRFSKTKPLEKIYNIFKQHCKLMFEIQNEITSLEGPDNILQVEQNLQLSSENDDDSILFNSIQLYLIFVFVRQDFLKFLTRKNVFQDEYNKLAFDTLEIKISKFNKLEILYELLRRLIRLNIENFYLNDMKISQNNWLSTSSSFGDDDKTNSDNIFMLAANFATKQMRLFEENRIALAVFCEKDSDELANIGKTIIDSITNFTSPSNPGNTFNIAQEFTRFPFGKWYDNGKTLKELFDCDTIDEIETQLSIRLIIFNSNKSNNGLYRSTYQMNLPILKYENIVDNQISVQIQNKPFYINILRELESKIKIIKDFKENNEFRQRAKKLKDFIKSIDEEVKKNNTKWNIERKKTASYNAIQRPIIVNGPIELYNFSNYVYTKESEINKKNEKYSVLWQIDDTSFVPLKDSSNNYIYDTFREIPNSISIYNILQKLNFNTNNSAPKPFGVRTTNISLLNELINETNDKINN